MACHFKMYMIRDVKEIEESTTWENTGKQIANKKKGQTGQNWIVLVLGDMTAGKSAMLRVLQSEYDPQGREPKSSQLIEFSHAQLGKQKHTLHCYQIGNRSLVPFIRRFKGQRERVVCLVCLDTTKGGQIIEAAGWYMNQIRATFGAGEAPALAEARKKHSDREMIQPMPVMTGIVGCKWDLFQTLKPDQIQWVSRGLRYMAHTNSSSLLSCSSKISKNGHQFRSAIQQFFLSGENEVQSSRDMSRPIFTKFGCDSVSEMKLPTMGNLSGLEAIQEELWRICGKEEKREKGGEQAPLIQGAIEEAIRVRRKGLAQSLRGNHVKAASQVDAI